jgi:septum formation protein
MAKIVLASGSPRRQELLQRIGIAEFAVRVPDADESYDPHMAPEEIVCHISRKKSLALSSADDEIVITADTMVFLDDKRLGKPKDEEDALQMLTALQGRHHTVCTGVTVRRGRQVLTEAETTTVRFRALSDASIRAYIATLEPMDKAGAYGIQGRGSLLVEGINGDFFNVMGLPVLRLARMLAAFGVELMGGVE